MLNVIKNGNNTILIVISIRMDQILAKAQKIHNANNLHIILNRYYEIEVINDVDVGAYAALEEVIEGMQIEKKPINPTHLFFSFIYDTRFKTIQWIVFDERGTYHWILKNEIPNKPFGGFTKSCESFYFIRSLQTKLSHLFLTDFKPVRHLIKMPRI